VRIVIRTSKWAIWARRLANLAVPLVVLPVLLYRFGQIDTATFLTSLAVALAVVLLTLVFAVAALVHLWNKGYLGWPKAIGALFVGLVCVSPFAYAAYQIEQYPAVTDVATAPPETLPLVLDAVTSAMNQPVLLPTDQAERVFPNARMRSYPLTVGQTYEMVLLLVNQRGWDVRLSRAPAGFGSDGRINARITSLLGWRDEVVLHVRPTADGSTVDMRSVSLDLPHDLGANGLRIEEFLVTLDSEITTLLRDNPNIAEPVEEPADVEPVVDPTSPVE